MAALLLKYENLSPELKEKFGRFGFDIYAIYTQTKIKEQRISELCHEIGQYDKDIQDAIKSCAKEVKHDH